MASWLDFRWPRASREFVAESDAVPLVQVDIDLGPGLQRAAVLDPVRVGRAGAQQRARGDRGGGSWPLPPRGR